MSAFLESNMLTRVCAFALIIFTTSVASATKITFDEAMKLARRNVALNVASMDSSIAEGDLDQAGTIAFNPEVSVAIGPTVDGPPERALEYEVSVSQTLELGGKRAKRTAAARARRNAAAQRLSSAQALLEARVRRVFDLAVVAKEHLATAREAESLAAELRVAAQERKGKGPEPCWTSTSLPPDRAERAVNGWPPTALSGCVPGARHDDRLAGRAGDRAGRRTGSGGRGRGRHRRPCRPHHDPSGPRRASRGSHRGRG